MKLVRRQFLCLAAGGVALPTLSLIAAAQAYPSRPVRLIVGFPPGGPADIVARLIGQWLSQRLGQQFVIENKPGAATNIATEDVAHSAPDGYTLLFVTISAAVNATLYERLNYNFIRDIAPVASISQLPLVMEVHPSVPARTVAEFIAYAKANPGKIDMASSGVGSGEYLAGELFNMATGINLVHVPYHGSAPALTALLAGQVQVYFSPIPSTIQYIGAGTLRALAVTSAARLDVLPDIPTVAASVPGYEVTSWQGIGAPSGTPTEIIDKLNKEIDGALADPKFKAHLADLGALAHASTPDEFARFIAAETEKWGHVIRVAGVKAE
jgi:tripartite-type tricarboxylate transporter receptor subunit TctC